MGAGNCSTAGPVLLHEFANPAPGSDEQCRTAVQPSFDEGLPHLLLNAELSLDVLDGLDVVVFRLPVAPRASHPGLGTGSSAAASSCTGSPSSSVSIDLKESFHTFRVGLAFDL